MREIFHTETYRINKLIKLSNFNVLSTSSFYYFTQYLFELHNCAYEYQAISLATV